MATVKLRVRGKKNPSPIYIRFLNGRKFDIEIKMNVFVNPEYFDNKNEKIRNVLAVKNRDELNKKFIGLKAFVLEKYNESYMYGEIIDDAWLFETIKEYFERPKHEGRQKIKPHYVYMYDFGKWWLENKAPNWKSNKGNVMSYRRVKNHGFLIELFHEFENGNKIRFNQLNADVLYKFIDYLTDEMNYSPATTKRYYMMLRFFVNRAKGEGIKGVPEIDERIYIKNTDNEKEDIMVPYLNEDEIQSIIDLDLSNDLQLDSVRDNFIIACWTGLRISDFNNKLDISNIKDDFIQIRTTKTGAWVEIPLHPHVVQVLNKRAGALPSKVRNDIFNKKLKTVLQLAEIDEEIKGYLFDKETQRKKLDVYPKFKLISAHTGRRSFATNLYGLVPNDVIMSVGGWKKEDVMLGYIKKTKREHSSVLKKKWEEKYNK